MLIDTSQTREIDRIDDPSQSIVRICTRVSKGSLFMEFNMRLVIAFVKHSFQFDSSKIYAPQGFDSCGFPLHKVPWDAM